VSIQQDWYFSCSDSFYLKPARDSTRAIWGSCGVYEHQVNLTSGQVNLSPKKKRRFPWEPAVADAAEVVMTVGKGLLAAAGGALLPHAKLQAHCKCQPSHARMLLLLLWRD